MRKRSPATELRQFKREAKEREAGLRDEIHRLRRSVELAETRLLEARRRTILGPDGEDWNFLPVAIKAIDIQREPITIRTGPNSALQTVGHETKATIVVSGELIGTAFLPTVRQADD